MNEKPNEKSSLLEKAMYMSTGSNPDGTAVTPLAPPPKDAPKFPSGFDPKGLLVLHKGVCIVCKKRNCYYVSNTTDDHPIVLICGGHCAQVYKDQVAAAVKLAEAMQSELEKHCFKLTPPPKDIDTTGMKVGEQTVSVPVSTEEVEKKEVD